VTSVCSATEYRKGGGGKKKEEGGGGTNPAISRTKLSRGEGERGGEGGRFSALPRERKGEKTP